MSGLERNPEALLDDLTVAAVEDRADVLLRAGDASVGQKLAALIEQASQLTATDALKADAATDMMVNLADRLGSQLERARARRARARALSYAGRFDEALRACREGTRLAQEAGSAIEAGRAQLASMHALGELGRLDEAIAVGETAREAFVQAGEPALAARADINLGIAHHRRDEPAEAVRCFERARPLLRDEPLIIGHLENSRGEALVALNDFEGARQAYAAARQAFDQANASLTAAIAEGNLAELAARQGRLHLALQHFEQARRHLERDGSPTHLARLLAEQAEAMSVLGMPREALREYEVALPQLDKCGLALEAARARSGMGQALLRLGNWASAETALAAAATGFEELKHATARAKVDLLRAEIAASNGRVGEAKSMALRAMSALHDRPADLIAARHLLARLALQSERLVEAEADLSAALALAVDLDLPPLRADVLFTRGQLRRRQQRLAEAAADFTAAIAQVERVRGTLQAERFRTAFLGDRAAVYEALVVARLDQAKVQTFKVQSPNEAIDATPASTPGDLDFGLCAFAAAEQAKSRSLLEQMQHATRAEPTSPRSDDEAEAALLAEMDRLRSDLNALYSRVGDERRGQPDAQAQAQAWRASVHALERQLDALESRLAATRGVGGLFARTVEAHDVARVLGSDEALLEFYAAGGELLAFVLHRGALTVHRRLATTSEIATQIEQIQFQMNRALRPGAMDGPRGARLIADARRELGKIWDLLAAPLHDAANGEVKRLIIVPHGPLHLLPFAALWNGERHLVQTHEVVVAPSASLLHHLRSGGGPANAERRAVVVGVSDEHAPRIADEARAISRMLECRAEDVLIDAQATVERFQRVASGASLIHLACHGRFDADSPNGSGLKLADRWLTLRDLYGLKLQADLVTLSGCETGVNLVKAGDELMGMLRAFFAAGAAQLLVTLWRVNDQITSEFMSAFYGSRNRLASAERLQKASAALRQVQLDAAGRQMHPAFWSAFVLVGAQAAGENRGLSTDPQVSGI